MNGITLLKEFADSQGIDLKEVDKFLSKYDNPQTLDELFEMPHDLLEHYNYISDVEQPLEDYIFCNLYSERHETIYLDRVVDSLYDDKYFFKSELEKGLLNKEHFEAKMEELREIEKHIIEVKFGSVVMDW